MHCAMLTLMTKAPPDLISADQACAILEVSRSTLTRWVAADVLDEAHKMPGKNGAFLFHRSDVEALRAKRQKDADTEAQAS